MNPYKQKLWQIRRTGTLDRRLLPYVTNEIGHDISRARIPWDVREILKVME